MSEDVRAPAAAARFPCSGCGASLSWDPAAGGLRCPFCGVVTAVAVGGGAVAEQDLAAALDAARREAEAPRAARRTDCESCGAVVEVPPTEKAGRCPYCGSSRVLEEDGAAARILPHAVLPFAVDDARARTLFSAWLRGLWFRPNALRTRSSLAEMRGVLVPFWTFDAHASSDWTALAGYHYWVTTGSGKHRRTVRHTRWVPASGSRTDSYDDHLVCASRGLDGGLLAGILPFPLGDLVPYREEYLAGWSAEVYAVDVVQGWEAAQAEILGFQERRCAGDVPGDTHSGLHVRTVVRARGYKHALLPVWVSSYRYRDRVYRFLVNGSTGEVRGDAPYSWVKILLLVLAILGAIGVVVAAS